MSLPPAISEAGEPVKIALPPSASLNNPPESMPQPPSHPLMANINASQQSTPEPDELAICLPPSTTLKSPPESMPQSLLPFETQLPNLPLMAHHDAPKQSTVARKDWPDKVISHPDGIGGYMTFSTEGTKVTCHVCGNKELFSCRRYSLAPVFSLSRHVSCDSHQKNLGSRKWSDKRDAKMRADGKKVLDWKYLTQSSLLSAFKRQTESYPQKAATSVISNPTNGVTSSSFTTNAASSSSTEKSVKKNVCTGIIPIKFLTTQPDLTKCNIVNIKRYCDIDTEKQYEIRGIDASNSQFNLFVKSCIGEVVHLIGKKQGGTRCTDCMNYWTLNSSRLKKMIKQYNKGIIHSQQCIIKPELTDEDYSGLVNLTRTDKKNPNQWR